MDGVATQSRARGFRIVASLLVVLVTAGACAGAFGQWSAASAALPRNLFSSGRLAIAGASVVMDARHLEPGETVTGAVVVANDGDAPGRFALGTSSLVDRPGAGGGSLARTLRVTVTDVTVTGASKRVFVGSPSAMQGADLGVFGPQEVRSYRVTVTFPREDVDAGVFAGSSLSFAFDWTAVTPG
jgi:hypothetical protein